MKKALLLLCVMSMPLCTYAQDWTKKLTEDVVEVIDDSFQTSETQLITFKNGSTIQIEFSAVSPTTVISRDMFLSIFSSKSLSICVGILNKVGVSMDDVQMDVLENSNDSPDIKIQFHMAEFGITMDIGTAEGTESETMTWEEYFKDN